MLIGHYGVALAIRSKEQSPSLGKLFIAVQWVDILFMVFVLMGIEKLRIVPGFTAVNPYDLYFMPYTHSVLAHFIWAGLALLVARLARRSWRTGWWLALAVFSHLLLDLPVHTADMPLAGDNTTKIGFGLWYNLPAALLVELAVFTVGLWLYARTRRMTRAMWIFGAALAAILLAAPFLPPPGSDTEAAIQGAVAFIVFTVIASWIERRAPSARS
jgi:membrane-bound metal-dependent hydrolase YbcI (DUF457 family)